MSGSGSFPDLRERMISAVVMGVAGLGALLLGGYWFLALMALVAGLMIWECIHMMAPDTPKLVQFGLPILAAGIVFNLIGTTGELSPVLPVFALLPVVPAMGLVVLRQHRVLFASYTIAILVAVAAIVTLRIVTGITLTLWLISLVIAADVGGYLAGRAFGGPKIFPRISPKKTWSGTLGGLALAALVGAIFTLSPVLNSSLIWFTVVTAAASQLGDVAESAIKRRVGVKDSSQLIPGHGGLLDRFDGLIGAALFVLLYVLAFGLPGAGNF